jgi:hypothetical protein
VKLAEHSRELQQTPLFGAHSLRTGEGIRIESDQITGQSDYSGTLTWRLQETFVNWGLPYGRTCAIAIPAFRPQAIRMLPPSEATYISYTPICGVEATSGPTLDELLRTATETLSKQLSVAKTLAVAAIDAPAVLQTARRQAGLPVQDLSTMFGVKRRQFYNLLNGDDALTSEREERIGVVTEAIGRISDAAGGDSRTVRTALLAQIDGDSVFDAAMAHDLQRIAAATSRAVEAVHRGEALRRRTPPSHRSDRKTAISAREEMHHSRDQMGYGPDEP